ATGLHILQHLRDFVTVDTWLDGKTVMLWTRWGRPSRAEPVSGLYVHPVSGILRRAPARKWTRRAKTITSVWLGADVECRLIDGVWYRFEYACHDPNEVAEVVRFHGDRPERNEQHGLTQPGDRRIIRFRDLPPGQAHYL